MSGRPKLTAEIIAASRKLPEFYFRRVLGIEPTDYQVDIGGSVRDVANTLVRSGHGTGKSFISAGIASWWFDCFPNSIAVVLAPTGGQADRVIGELNHLRANALFELPGDRLTKKLRGGPKWYVVPRVANDPENFAGFHSDYVLLIYEEASGIEQAMAEVALGAAAGEHDRKLWIGNPTQDAGPFHSEFERGDGPTRRTFTIASTDTPNYRLGRTVIRGLATRQYVESVLEQCNGDTNSDLYRVRVAGLPPKSSRDGAFNVHMLELARMRGESFDLNTLGPEHPYRAGVDLARSGDDWSGLVSFRGQVLHGLDRWQLPDATKTREKVLRWMADHPGAMVSIDLGYMPTVHDDLKLRYPLQVHGVNFGAGQALGKKLVNHATGEGRDWYKNRRTELWCEAAAWTAESAVFTPAIVRHPHFQRLEADLLAPRVEELATGSRILEPKKKIRKRLRRSPDLGDAYCLAVAEAQGQGFATVTAGAAATSPATEGYEPVSSWRTRRRRGPGGRGYRGLRRNQRRRGR